MKYTTMYIHVQIPTMLTELLYPLQDGYTPLVLAAMGGHTTCVERLLSTPVIDVNIKDEVSTGTACYWIYHTQLSIAVEVSCFI